MRWIVLVGLSLGVAGTAAAQGASGEGKAPPATPGAAGQAPAQGAGAADAAPAKRLRIRVPSGNEFSAYFEEDPAGQQTFRDQGELPLPAGKKSVILYVLDTTSGYAARKSLDVDAAPAELSLASRDFNLVQRVRVTVTGKEDRPIAQGVVTLTDGNGRAHRRTIHPTSAGVAEFEFVVSGAGRLSVAPRGGSEMSKAVSIDLPRGSTVQEVPVALPEVTETVAGAEPEPEPPAGPVAPPSTVVTPPAPAAAPAAAPATGGGGWAQTLVGFIILAVVLGGAYVWAKNRGITTEMILSKLGVRPDEVQAQAAGAGAAPAPGPAPAPPPVVADPNQCPFCGQLKQPDGSCACSVLPGRSPAGPAAAAASLGPRLVGMAGSYLGEVFPLAGSVVVGREPGLGVSLDRDTTASRRHAQITVESGAFEIRDLGSSNGTFVNGARVEQSPLQPGDEIGIGSSRFRFEV